MTVCGTEAFKEVIRVDSKPIGLVSLREEEIRAQPHIEEGHVRALGADSRLQAKERPLILNFQPPEG